MSIDVIKSSRYSNYFRLVLFQWTVGARDLMPERKLAEIIELQYKYVYLFKREKWFVDEPVLRTGPASAFPSTLKLFNAGLMALTGSLFFL